MSNPKNCNQQLDSTELDVLLSWRKQLLYAIFSCLLVLLAIPYLVSAQKSIHDEKWLLLGIHTIVFVSIFIVFIFRCIPFRITGFLGLTSLYIVAVTALVNFGPIGSGRIWLFSFSLFGALLFGLQTGIVTVILNALTLFSIYYLMNQGYLVWVEPIGSPLRIWGITSITFLFLNMGFTVSIALLVRNLEERLRKEYRLRLKVSETNLKILESEEKLEQVIQGNPIATFVIDNDHVITHWNNVCAKLTQIPADEMIGSSKQWMAFGNTKEKVLADFVLMVEKENMAENNFDKNYRKSNLIDGGYEEEISVSRVDKKEQFLFSTAVPLQNRSGETIGAVQTFLDMTERRNIEARLRQTHKMEAVGQLAGGVAHDFNNILMVINGSSDFILNNKDLDPVIRDDIKEIKKSGIRAAALTRQLLLFSRKQIIETKIINLNDLIENMLKMLGRLIGEDVQLNFIPASPLDSIKIDPGQMEQVIMNLAVNARDAMQKGGVLTLETNNVVLDEDYTESHDEVRPGPHVMLAVSDTGHGMDKETQKRIFDPFYTTKERGNGTGLGLSTVYGIVKQCQGNIWVYSEPEKGTTFRLYFPIVEKLVQDTPQNSESVRSLHGIETILIVEDDEMVRKLSSRVLKKYGYTILEARNGIKALEICKEYEDRIDLVLTDVIMPEMGGPELVEIISKTYSQIKVIYMSGYTDNTIAHHGILDEGIAFLNKPASSDEIGIKVREILDKS